MNESIDLRQLLESWPYDPEDNVRLVAFPGGREVLQVRLPLGVEQYELDGRPDGQTPNSKESLLEYHLERLADAKALHQESSFELDSDECADLFSEATLYYYRYLNLFQLKDWPRTIRDTTRNLRLFDFVHRYAAAEDDQFYLEQWRPYLIRMNSVATAMHQLEKGEYSRALETVSAASRKIELLDDIDDETFQYERQRSLEALLDLAEQIEANKPLSEQELLERELNKAIETQHFERAAELRNRLRALRAEGKSAPG
jgi:hypothetical protein